MTFRVLLFATIKDKIGKSSILLEHAEPLTVSELLQELFQKYPQLKQFENRMLVAVNQNYAVQSQLVNPNDEVALFPPVSGG